MAHQKRSRLEDGKVTDDDNVIIGSDVRLKRRRITERKFESDDEEGRSLKKPIFGFGDPALARPLKVIIRRILPNKTPNISSKEEIIPAIVSPHAQQAAALVAMTKTYRCMDCMTKVLFKNSSHGATNRTGDDNDILWDRNDNNEEFVFTSRLPGNIKPVCKDKVKKSIECNRTPERLQSHTDPVPKVIKTATRGRGRLSRLHKYEEAKSTDSKFLRRLSLLRKETKRVLRRISQNKIHHVGESKDKKIDILPIKYRGEDDDNTSFYCKKTENLSGDDNKGEPTSIEASSIRDEGNNNTRYTPISDDHDDVYISKNTHKLISLPSKVTTYRLDDGTYGIHEEYYSVFIPRLLLVNVSLYFRTRYGTACSYEYQSDVTYLTVQDEEDAYLMIIMIEFIGSRSLPKGLTDEQLISLCQMADCYQFEDVIKEVLIYLRPSINTNVLTAIGLYDKLFQLATVVATYSLPPESVNISDSLLSSQTTTESKRAHSENINTECGGKDVKMSLPRYYRSTILNIFETIECFCGSLFDTSNTLHKLDTLSNLSSAIVITVLTRNRWNWSESLKYQFFRLWSTTPIAAKNLKMLLCTTEGNQFVNDLCHTIDWRNLDNNFILYILHEDLIHNLPWRLSQYHKYTNTVRHVLHFKDVLRENKEYTDLFKKYLNCHDCNTNTDNIDLSESNLSSYSDEKYLLQSISLPTISDTLSFPISGNAKTFKNMKIHKPHLTETISSTTIDAPHVSSVENSVRNFWTRDGIPWRLLLILMPPSELSESSAHFTLSMQISLDEKLYGLYPMMMEYSNRGLIKLNPSEIIIVNPLKNGEDCLRYCLGSGIDMICFNICDLEDSTRENFDLIIRINPF